MGLSTDLFVASRYWIVRGDGEGWGALARCCCGVCGRACGLVLAFVRDFSAATLLSALCMSNDGVLYILRDGCACALLWYVLRLWICKSIISYQVRTLG